MRRPVPEQRLLGSEARCCRQTASDDYVDGTSEQRTTKAEESYTPIETKGILAARGDRESVVIFCLLDVESGEDRCHDQP